MATAQQLVCSANKNCPLHRGLTPPPTLLLLRTDVRCMCLCVLVLAYVCVCVLACGFVCFGVLSCAFVCLFPFLCVQHVRNLCNIFFFWMYINSQNETTEKENV